MKWKIIENRLVKTFLLEKNSEIAERIQALLLIANAHKQSANYRLEEDEIIFELNFNEENDMSTRDFKMARIVDQIFC